MAVKNLLITMFLMRLFCMSLLIIRPVFADTSQSNAQQSIQVAVLPYLAPTRLEAMYAPVVLGFGELLHKKAYLRTSTSSIDYYKQLEKQVFDIAIVNPFDSVPVIDKFNYVPLAARPLHRCRIVTAANSKIESLRQVRGKVVGVASKRSPISFYSLRAIESQGLKAGVDFTVKYHKTTQACLHNLMIQKIDVCSAGGVTSSIFIDKRKVDLKTIGQCEAFPGMVIVAHARISSRQREQLKQYILGWSSQADSHIAKRLGKHAKFVAYEDQDFKMIRQHRKQWQQLGHHVP